jgi:RNA polymerase sigma-70 factor (ECF subfamily)
VTLDPAARAALQRDMVRLADGDRAAFEPVFARLWPLLRGVAARQLPAAEAEDAAQRALLAVFERASELDPARDAVAWAVGIVGWEVRTARRRSWRRRGTVELPDESALPPAAEAGPEERAMASELAGALGRTLAVLAPADADALLRDAAGDRPPGDGFRKRLQRARARLRAAWRKAHG